MEKDFKEDQIEDVSIVEETAVPEAAVEDVTSVEPTQGDADEKHELTEEEKKQIQHNFMLKNMVAIIHKMWGRANLWAIKHYAEKTGMSIVEMRVEVEEKRSPLSSNARQILLNVLPDALAEILEVKSGVAVEDAVDDTSITTEDSSLSE